MPVTVAVDSGGTSAHITGPAIWAEKIAKEGLNNIKGIAVNSG
jgi:fumarate hydratase class I